MPNITAIQNIGSHLKAIFDDNSTQLFVPTVTDALWYATHIEPPPPPPPPPASGGRFMWPFDPRPMSQGGTVSSEYGYRDGRLHAGIDMAVGMGTPVPAAGSGTIQISSPSHGGYGEAIVIDHGDGIATLYGHMMTGTRTVGVGANVVKGQIIGKADNTGASFGSHLHWETHTGGYRWNASSMNPRDFMARYGL